MVLHRLGRIPFVVASAAFLCLAVLAWGQDEPAPPRFTAATLVDDFEDPETSWIAEGGDVNHEVRVHDRSLDTAHSGQRAERISVLAGMGTNLYFGCPIGRALVDDQLKLSVWVKADRPGVQLYSRVVFPRERDPDSLQLLGTLIPGTVYERAGSWQRLELPRPDLAAGRQARLLRASLGRDIDTREAYVDRVLLNVYAGPGEITVHIDDLEVSPVLGNTMRLSSAVLGQPAESAGPHVEISQDRLLVADRPRLMRAIRAPGLAPAKVKEFGFNVLAVEWPLNLAQVEEAVTSHVWLMPFLPNVLDTGPAARSLNHVLGEVPFRDAVLCWYLGSELHGDSCKAAASAVRELHAASPRRPVAADVTDAFYRYSREVDMLGARCWPIGTSMDIREYRDWLAQRRYLARPGTYFFTWVQLASNPAITQHVPAVGGPEPDQIRLLTYGALAAGCRGLGFWSDESLGQTRAGQARLYQLGLLNLELQLLEPYFAAAGSVTTIDVETSVPENKRGPGADTMEYRGGFGRKRGMVGGFAPMAKSKPEASRRREREDVQATRLHSDRGLVVMPIWYGKGAQFVPGQLAANDLSMVIPGIPDAAQAWQVTPAELRMLKRERVTGGMRLTVPEFDLTSIIVLTSDTSTLEQLRKDIAKTAPFAALWAAELATLELEKVKLVNSQLVALGRNQPDGKQLIESAEKLLESSRALLAKSDFKASYMESQRAMRALRILERAHWDDAVKDLALPQSSPYATSFATLPDHWRMMHDIRVSQFGPNMIVGGDFESADTLLEEGWTQLVEGDELDLKTTLSAQNPQSGSRSLHLQLAPKNGEKPPAALEPLIGALVSKPVPVKAGDLVRIRFQLRVPNVIEGSVEGAVIYDSIGGPALAVTQTQPLEWKQFTLYRRVMQPDDLTITIGLTGAGNIFVDDLIVDRVVSGTPLTQEESRPRR